MHAPCTLLGHDDGCYPDSKRLPSRNERPVRTRILITEDPGERQSCFRRPRKELDLYTLIEQHTLYPALSDGNELVKLIDRSYDEHDDMSDRAEEINQMENAPGNSTRQSRTWLMSSIVTSRTRSAISSREWRPCFRRTI